MFATSECAFYERIAVTGCPDGCVRPGGLGLTDRALELCAFPPGSRILDMGCGTGTTVKYLLDRRGFFAVGVDPSERMIARGKACAPLLPLVRGDVLRLPFPDGWWDGTLAECSLSLVADLEAALRECRRALKPGGCLAVSDLYARNPAALPELRSLGRECCLTGAFSREELLKTLQRCGFTVHAWEDHSAALKQFAAQLILSGISPGDFWRPIANRDSGGNACVRQAVSRANPGYFLMVARKAV